MVDLVDLPDPLRVLFVEPLAEADADLSEPDALRDAEPFVERDVEPDEESCKDEVGEM